MPARNNKKPGFRGQRTTRHEPPGVEEAIIAAQGLADDVESQVEIAASLIGLPEDEIRPLVLRSRTPSIGARVRSLASGREGARTIVVERRRVRIPAR
jgi:hypothetical protein